MYLKKTLTAIVYAVCAILPATAETLLPGVLAEYYSFGDVTLSSMPDLDALPPDECAVLDSINQYATGAAWPGLDHRFEDNFAVRYTARLYVPEGGMYTFILESDDGSILSIDESLIIDNSSLHAMNRISSTIRLGAGYHDLRLDYFEKDGSAGVRLSWSGSGVDGIITSAHLAQDVSVDASFYADLYGVPTELIAGLVSPEAWAEALADSEEFSGYGQGLQVEYYSFRDAPLSSLPDFSKYSPRRVGFSDKLSYAWCGMNAAVGYDSAFSVSFASRHFGYLYVNSEGDYDFSLKSDDGSRLIVDGRVVIDNDGIHAVATETGRTHLTSGMHAIEVLFFGNFSDNQLQLKWKRRTSMQESVIPSTLLFHREPSNFAPSVSVRTPVPGGLFAVGQRIPLTAEASDSDGEVCSVSYYTGSGQFIGTATNAPWLVEWSVAVGGTSTVYAVATDDSGAPRRSAPVSFEVRPPPRGCGHGLKAVFRQKPGKIPDEHDGATFGTIVREIDYPSVATAWDGLPQWMTNNYTAVFSGYLFVERADYYTVRIASDDGSKIWLDGELLIDHGTAHSYTAKEGYSYLPAGLHSVRIEYFEDEGDAGLGLMWSCSAFAMRTIAPYELVHATEGIDSDHDGMDDWWEEYYGLDFTSADDAAHDEDGDGISNLEEFRQGTNPCSADTDGDGMPDAWEIAHGTHPFVVDAFEDPDRDGLTNIDEYLAGTDPLVADTDGDGCPDGIEVWNVRSNPTVADLAWGRSTSVGAAVPANNPASSTGIWNIDSEGVIFAGVRAGSLTWNLTVPAPGADALAIRVVQHEFYSYQSDFDLSLRVDGMLAARTSVHAPYGEPGDAFFFIPEVTPGEHEFRLVWNNWDAGTFLGVIDLRFVNFGGPDADGNGVADWRDTRDAQGARLNPAPDASLVSPVCIEGCGMWGEGLVLGVDYGSSNAVYSVVRTIGDGFYADIPLAEDGPAAITLAANGHTNLMQVAWKAFDVFDGDYAEDALIIRTGDALRFAHGDEFVEYSVSKRKNNSWNAFTNFTASAACSYRFVEVGSYLVTARAPGILADDEAFALVEVVSSRFPSRNPAVELQGSMDLKCPGLNPANVLEHDSGLSVIAEPSGTGLKLSVYAPEDRDYGLVSRLEENGPISDAVQATPVWFDNGTYCRVLQTYADGSQRVEVSLLLGAIPEGTTVQLSIFVSGVTFEDGTRNKTLTADDFDENGMCSIIFIKARGVTTSVCHHTYIRQNGNLVDNN